jgi:hypothetical protein
VRHYSLTGLQQPQGEPQRAVLAVKVDDTAAGRPQQGVDLADLVVQEPVEGGLTRLMAFYESRRPESVGPVRSVRTTDIPLATASGAIVMASGGSPAALAAFDSAGVTLISEGDAAFARNPDRVPPYNLYADTTRVSRADTGRPRPASLLTFGPFDFPDGRKVERVDVRFSPAAVDTWALGPGRRWRRDDERPFPADTLLILGVALADTGLQDAAGSPVPEARLSGKGGGFLISRGMVHIIRWRKDSAADPLVLSTRAGLTAPVPPGRTWIALLPKDTGSVSFD